MGRVIGQDKIGALTEAGGTITLGPSTLTIGGQQFRTTTSLNEAVPSLSNGALRFIYAVLDGNGDPEIIISDQVNSVGPGLGNVAWKLVGAFYADGINGSFGSFVNIEGSPKTNKIPFTPTTNWTNTVLTGFFKRDSDEMLMEIKVNLSGTPTANTLVITWDAGTGQTEDGAKLISSGITRSLGIASYFDSGSNQYMGRCIHDSSGAVRVAHSGQQFSGGVPLNSIDTPSDPITWAVNDNVTLDFKLPIVGWNNTPLKDL